MNKINLIIEELKKSNNKNKFNAPLPKEQLDEALSRVRDHYEVNSCEILRNLYQVFNGGTLIGKDNTVFLFFTLDELLNVEDEQEFSFSLMSSIPLAELSDGNYLVIDYRNEGEKLGVMNIFDESGCFEHFDSFNDFLNSFVKKH